MRGYSEYKGSGVEWLGEIPSHWGSKRLKYHAPLVTEKATNHRNPLGLENIESWTGRYLHTGSKFEGLGTAFKNGDLLFGKLRPYLAKVLLTNRNGEAVGDFHVLRPIKNVVPRFLQYHMLTREFISVVDGSTYGTKMPRASWNFVGNMYCVCPSHDEQELIANYLDRETARIDKLITEKQNFIKLLKEKRHALISHVVTKGLDPDVKMKASGIEWIGEVPEHWKCGKLKFVAKISNGATPNRDTNEFWENGDVGWLNSSKVNDVVIVQAQQFITDLAVQKTSVQAVKPNDVVIAITGEGQTRGRVAICKTNATINQHLAAISIVDPEFSYEFLFYWLTSQYSRIRYESSGAGSTKGAITCADIGLFPLPMPPLEEQIAITLRIKMRLGKYDELLKQTGLSIELLKEHRTALISAAVTGKIDVRDQARESAT